MPADARRLVSLIAAVAVWLATAWLVLIFRFKLFATHAYDNDTLLLIVTVPTALGFFVAWMIWPTRTNGAE